MRYTEQETKKEVDNAINNISELYKKGFVNWSGQTKDTRKEYSEVVVEGLLDGDVKNKFSEIDVINRKNYNESHEKIEIKGTNREEENYAKCLVKSGIDYGEIGKFIDFQIPLKLSNKDKEVGKIDLISVNSKSKTVYLVELKYNDSPDTLLKCILEISTYYQIINKQNFLKSFDEIKDCREENIKKAVLIFQNSEQYKEIEKLKENKLPKLKELIKELEINIFIISSEIKKEEI